MLARHGLRGRCFGQAVDFQLREDRFFDGGVAGVAGVEGAEAPAVVGLVASVAGAGAAPGGDAAAGEGGLGLLRGDVAAGLGGGGAGGAGAGDLPGVVEVPEVDAGEVGVGVDLVVVVGAGLAEAVAGEAGVDVDVADFVFVFVGLGGRFVEVVDGADAVVEGLAERDAEVRVVVEGVDGGDAPVLPVAPRVVVGAEELRVAGQIQQKVRVLARRVVEKIVEGFGQVEFHPGRVCDIGCCIGQSNGTVSSPVFVAPVGFAIVMGRIRVVDAYVDDMAKPGIVSSTGHDHQSRTVSHFPHLMLADCDVSKLAARAGCVPKPRWIVTGPA